MAAAIASGCLTGSTPADRSEVIRQILPTTVQLRCERDANDRRAASGVVVGRDSGTRRAWVVTTRHFLEPLKAQKVYVKAAGDQARVAAHSARTGTGDDTQGCSIDEACPLNTPFPPLHPLPPEPRPPVLPSIVSQFTSHSQ